MKENGLVGLGLITYNRLDYLKQCLESLEKNNFGGADYVIIVDDGSTDGTRQFIQDYKRKGVYYLCKIKNSGVANSKNEALKRMMDYGCEHMFLMEDDILMKHPQTCHEYIKWAEKWGLQHMNFALHGTMNVDSKFTYWETDDEKGTTKGITVYPNCVGAFSYYTREVIEVIGYMDENLKNAWEHVWHTLLISEMDYTTPFWFFADHPASHLLLQEIPGSIDNSSIRPRDDWQENIQKGKAYLIQRYGRFLPERPY
jgi:glycosyltransferase involved in cell wall biosynthesis